MSGKPIWELAGYTSMQEFMLAAKERQRAALKAKPPAGQLTAEAADERAGGRWFSGDTNAVRVEEDVRFDGERVIGARGSEYLLFEGGMRGGVLRMPGSRSIVVVRGDLELERLEFTDDVLVVTGALRTRQALALPGRSEGILQAGGVDLLRPPP